MMFEVTGPCVESARGIDYMIAALAAMNVAFNAWLANRRLLADKRESVRDGDLHIDCPLDQKKIDAGPSRRTTARKK